MGLDRTTDMKLRLVFFILVSLMPAPTGLRAQVTRDPLKCFSIADSGAVADGKTLNTKAIQEAIDLLATGGGGTLVVPKGIFLTASIFLKPSVNLHLEEGAVLKGSTNASDYPRMRTRIEGHYEQNFLPALVNADRCDRLNISGTGILDGSGEPYWQAFWAGHAANKSFKNLDVLRPQMALIENSEGPDHRHHIQGLSILDPASLPLQQRPCGKCPLRGAGREKVSEFGRYRCRQLPECHHPGLHFPCGR